MESPAPASRYVAQSSKKRVFSSSAFKDVEVLEIDPPPKINRASKPNSSKQKEVICHEIIDVDVEEDHGDVLHIKGNSKGKKALTNSSAGLQNFASDISECDYQKLKYGPHDDYNPNLFYGEDEWIDTYYDDIVYDDYSVMESHFDHMDFPSGVEAPFPWLSNSAEDDTKARGPTTLSSEIINQAATQNPKKKLPSKWSEGGPSLNRTVPSSSSTDFFTSKSSSGSLLPGTSSSLIRKSKRSRFISSSHNKFSSGAMLPSTVNNHSGYPTLNMSSSAPGVGMHMPMWPNLPLNMLEPLPGSSTFMNGSGFVPMVQHSADNHGGVTSAKVDQRNADKMLQDFAVFKRFDTVEDYSDHHFANNASSAKLAQKNWAKRIQEEWKILEKDLPDTIFVRVYESRMDLLRAVIIGAERTPYHDGLFFFDVFFPTNYPSVPPKVHYHSGGLRINPNLYNCGKVCLSLLNTWMGHGKEKWISGVSTMLQVLVSFQGLILNAKPYFNEPGYANMGGTKHGEEKSLEYNERTFMYTLQTMVYSMRRPPKHFEAYVVGHFCKCAREILVSCKAYLDGAQVGCLVKGGVQDVDEGDRSCSKDFRNGLAGYITTLVNAFTQIGAKDCREFLSLAQRRREHHWLVPGIRTSSTCRRVKSVASCN